MVTRVGLRATVELLLLRIIDQTVPEALRLHLRLVVVPLQAVVVLIVQVLVHAARIVEVVAPTAVVVAPMAVDRVAEGRIRVAEVHAVVVAVDDFNSDIRYEIQ